MSNQNPQGDQKRQWWLSKQGKSVGPYDATFILDGLRSGKIPPDTFACLVGGQTWKRLNESATFAPACPAATTRQAQPPELPVLPPQPPDFLLPEQSPLIAPAAWNPGILGLLGLIFSPLWVGIMAAINARRLRTGLPAWRPILIGLGATLLDIMVSTAITDSIFVDLVLYLGALGLIWGLDLAPQIQLFEKQQAATHRQAAWLIPCLAGGPCALVVMLTLVVVPLLPLEPREVCRRFVDAKSLNGMKKYTSTKLWPALEAFDAQPDEPGLKGRIELTEEEVAPPELGGYLVGCHMYFKPKAGRAYLAEGIFHLVNLDGSWKVEELYFTSFDGHQLPEPVRLSVDYREMLNSSDHPEALASAGAKGTNSTSPMGKVDGQKHNPYSNARGPWRILAFAYDKFGWIGVIGVILALAGVGACCNTLRAKPASVQSNRAP